MEEFSEAMRERINPRSKAIAKMIKPNSNEVPQTREMTEKELKELDALQNDLVRMVCETKKN